MEVTFQITLVPTSYGVVACGFIIVTEAIGLVSCNQSI
jgi:hypothetical protein